jgi:hypothetical protein
VKLWLSAPCAFIMWCVIKDRDNSNFGKFITINEINVSSKRPILYSLCNEPFSRKSIVLFYVYVKKGLY